MSARLRVALAHLPPKQADAFCLHCLEGFSYREVAQQLDTTTTDVGVCVHRARSALKQHLAFILSSEAPMTTGTTETRTPRSEEVSR
jgi:DNA-directed RNA polymerase specialized sigma24 family protein